MWQKLEYAMIFMDGQMPELDGFAATEMIRTREKVKDQKGIPIIAMTANAMAQDQRVVWLQVWMTMPVSI